MISKLCPHPKISEVKDYNYFDGWSYDIYCGICGKYKHRNYLDDE